MSMQQQSAVNGPRSPEAEARVRDLMAQMTLEEKLAQLVGLWEGRGAAARAETSHRCRTRCRRGPTTSRGMPVRGSGS